MADVQQPRSSQSHIPVFTPRKPLPSTLSTPHLGLVPPSRHLSVSGSPTHPSPGSTSSSTSGGLTPFRSFRNLFSTTGSKQTSAGSKSPFGAIRRSIHGERSVSAPQLRRESSYEDSPVLEIELPRPGMEPLINSTDMYGIGLGMGTMEMSLPRFSPAASFRDDASSPSPSAGPTDLSTIIEAENSGISKHIPVLDSSQEFEPPPENLHDPSLGIDAMKLHAGSYRRVAPGGFHTPPSHTSSELDLSTSKVTTEVMAAMSKTGPLNGWLDDVVVDVGDEDALTAHGAAGDPNVSFNLGALDPDLAALLSPNRLPGSEPALLMAIDTDPSPTLSSQLTPLLPSLALKDDSPRRPTLSGSTPTSRGSSPIRQGGKAAYVSKAPNLPSTALPRLARSVSDRPALPRLIDAPSPLTHRALSHSPERPSTSGVQRSSPRDRMDDDDHLARRPHTGTVLEARKSTAARLWNPTRSAGHLTPGGPSRPSSRQLNRGSPHGWEGPPASPTSRPSSSAGTGSSSRLASSRPSLDSVTDRLQRPARIRNRERSSSVVETGVSSSNPSSRPAAAEWLGPRTAKAFAAAGLLDFDREVSRRTPSRLGMTRSSFDDSRSRYTPSRMAFSEAGSSSSWGQRSGSISRAGSVSRTITDTGGGFTESVSASTPRTAFSGVSTAPTSVSTSSSAHLHSELQLLQERHSVETGALLSALADSQRTTRVLRDENTQLRDRLQGVEDRLAAALEEIRRLQFSSPPQATISRVSHRKFTTAPTDTSHLRRPSFFRPDPDPSFELPSSPEPANPVPRTPTESDACLDGRHKRISTSSSLFPGPPSNMSMLMQEESMSVGHAGAHSERAGSTGSPTLVLGKINSSRYEHEQSAPSVGNISPTTANFSMATGSPGSLHLRPEHELHLDDMPSLDLGAEFGHDDGFDDECP
ncbi:uncharacterized protein FIBRA_06323 [Fibroporia radiculosa]|uniref:Uncharacterized protein n=1 Tax=Fibroporia radiculosa TaxID=599839 RepID=J4IB73_9APHY|nr:uncharacterized protein FIBRA_06323 [Fibroporia radiculosa]CCM04161.1 predicted protein [Fibroporia radiculosa]